MKKTDTIVTCSCGQRNAWANTKKAKITSQARTLIDIFRHFHEGYGHTVTLTTHTRP